ncbi:tetratricopeptide repeat protein [Variovorax sp. H27-G14]|uniref:tetratricopeptide repeat protein n=1 Tax=Variovorax sp. H27-G14 TaxID=3111914 RepID=UPI0038FC5534
MSMYRASLLRWPPLVLVIVLAIFSLTACNMINLPRNTNLKAFDPHRAEFTCKYEADANPPITSEAEALFQQGLAATSYDLWPDKRDYVNAAELWKKAADLGHWKAAMNLAGLYEQGLGVPRDTEQAVLIIEGLMKRGVPAAFDKMGTYHQRGIGVKGDTSRAYAFWQLAADMGSAAAQAYLGPKLDAAYDNPSQGFWGNSKVGLKMLECGFAQGNGNAAFELALSLENTDGNTAKEYARALRIYHDGVKFGSKESARNLSVSFDEIEPLTGNTIDTARADRYRELRAALELNPDLRFPNLDKVLPLPPAELPTWDGQRDTLVDAAKGLVIAPKVQPTPGSQRTGRAHFPQGHVLRRPVHPLGAVEVNALVPYSGYWMPRLYAVHRKHEEAWEHAQVPQRYDKGEAFEAMDRSSMGEYAGIAPRTVWHFLGVAVAATVAVHPRVAQGIARMTRAPELLLRCRGGMPCPRTGVWFGQAGKAHPLAALYDRWDRMAYVTKDQSFPMPRDQYIDLDPHDVHWTWLDNANQPRSNGIVDVTLTDLHGEQGKRKA